MEISDLLNYILIGIVATSIIFGITIIITISTVDKQMNLWLPFLMRVVDIFRSG
ncbi:MAG: hypothetical protein ACTSRG_10860 [Candidatus Helarchaeota archaeon]